MSHPSFPFQLTFSSDEFTAGAEVRIRSTKRTVMGLVRLDGDRLHLQIGETHAIQEVTDVGFRTRTEPRPVSDREIPLGQIAEVRLERRLLGWRVRLAASDLRAFEGIPGARGVELRLPVDRANRERAAEFVGAVELALADLALLRAGGDRPEAAP